MRRLEFQLVGPARSPKRDWRLASVLLLGGILFFAGKRAADVPLASIYPSKIDFGDQELASASRVQRATLVNLGTRPVEVRTAVIGGDDGAFEKQDDGCTGVTLGVHDSCSIGFEFTPKTAGEHSAEVFVTAGINQTVYKTLLLGTGTQSEVIAVHPHSLDFGGQLIDSKSEPRSVTLRNAGGLPIRFRNLTPQQDAGEAEFQIAKENCSSGEIGAGRQCTIRLLFAPRQLGRRSALLIVREPDTASANATFKIELVKVDQQEQKGQHVAPIAGDGIKPKLVQLRVERAGEGTITSNPAGITCPGTCTAEFSEGKSVQLTSTPSQGWQFYSWAGACVGSTACIVPLTSEAKVTATFSQIPTPRVLTVSMVWKGDGCGDSIDGRIASVPPGISCVVPNSKINPRALYLPAEPQGILIRPLVGVQPQRLANVFTRVSQSEGTVCSHAFSSGEKVKLTAFEGSSTQFRGYSGACSTKSQACDLVMDGDKNVTATFCTPLLQ